MENIVITFHSLLSIALAVTVSIISLSIFPIIEGNNVGFSIDLIHRDSPASPFYNSSFTRFACMSNALQRSVNRVNHFRSASTSPQSASTEVISNNGEYLMKIAIGTPRFNIVATADTGSDLIWTQCKPCIKCFKQKDPLFNPKSSSTYKGVPYQSKSCQSLPRTSSHNNGTCAYSISYGDKSYSHGTLATEKVTLGSTTGRPVSLPGIIFGCGYNNGGSFEGTGSGIVGLGGGQASLVYQMNSSIGGKFSYCLVPNTRSKKSSKMYFGDKAKVSGKGVVSTPVVSKSPNTFYFLTLEGFTVGSQRLEFYNSSSSPNASGKGNIIIDSGTTFTFLPSDVYSRLESSVKSAIEYYPVQEPQNVLQLCYRFRKNMKIPTITARFTCADVKLKTLNAFIRTKSNNLCLAFAPANDIAVFGNRAQMDFLIGYDLRARTVSFKPTICAFK